MFHRAGTIAAGLSLLMLSTPLAANAATLRTPSATPGVTPITGQPTFSSLSALKKWANTNHINVIVANSSGLPVKEFQTNGEDVSLSYNTSHSVVTITDQFGRKRVSHLVFPGKAPTTALTSRKNPVTDPTYNGSSYTVDGYNLTDLISNYWYTTNVANLTQSAMQAEFNNLNSVLKNNIEEYTYSNGTYVNDGWSVNPAALIMADCNEEGINPWVVLATLQKEQGLVFASNAGVSSLAWAMGWGATDSGNIYPDSGFANQVTGGTSDLANLYWQGLNNAYPVFMTVNGGNWQYWNGNSYGPTVDIQNAATWALYQYTPWACEVAPSGPYGGNLLFAEEYNAVGFYF